jgi:hypothetical protein
MGVKAVINAIDDAIEHPELFERAEETELDDSSLMEEDDDFDDYARRKMNKKRAGAGKSKKSATKGKVGKKGLSVVLITLGIVISIGIIAGIVGVIFWAKRKVKQR